MEFLSRVSWPDWYQDAQCYGEHPKMFFGEDKGDEVSKHAADMTDEEVRNAKQICEGCPVIEECREYALTNFIDYGIWGGMTHRERLGWWREFGGRRYLRNVQGFVGPF